ncbi:MAG TPA: sugar transferase [Anaerolineales bacterium]|nr:sugar transferase [Anaerolineales bacterium]
MTAPTTAQALRISPSLRLIERRWLIGFGDVLVAILCSIGAVWIWSLSDPGPSLRAFFAERLFWLIALPLLWLTISFVFLNLQRLPQPRHAWREVVAAALISLLFYIVLFFFAQPTPLPRLVVLYFVGLVSLSTLAWRAAYVRLFSLPALQHRLLIIGAGRAGQAILEALREAASPLSTIVGVIDDDRAKHGQLQAGFRVLGDHTQVRQLIETHDVSEIVLAISGELNPGMFQALLDCQARNLPIIRMSTLFEDLTGRVPLEHLDVQWLSGPASDAMQHALYFAAKRFIDIVSGLVGLMVVLVVTPFIALAIRLEDGGPVFYNQIRLGRNGRSFTILKFRTMITDAENGQAQWAVENDERVTRVGRFLRRTRLDETPQFLNVLRGEMSLVGPRPERPEFFTELEREQPLFRARLLVKPGITGWAQVNYGYASTLQDNVRKLQWDLYYVKHMSPWLDSSILLNTVGVVLRLKGT